MTALLAAISLFCTLQTPTDAELVRMGHKPWIAQFDPADKDALTGAERRFAMALGLHKEQLILANPDKEALEEIDILLSNITKGAARIADAALAGSGNEFLYNAKAATLMVLTMQGFLLNQAAPDKTTQSDAWNAYREVEAKHRANLAQIAVFAEQHGGYSPTQHMREYRSLGRLMFEVIGKVRHRTPSQKGHIFSALRRFVRLTVGDDPLPY